VPVDAPFLAALVRPSDREVLGGLVEVVGHNVIADCDRKLANYRMLLDTDDPVTVATEWIADTQREMKALERQHVPGCEFTPTQVKALVAAVRDIIEVLVVADPADKADLYRELGVTLRYDPAGMVSVQAHPRGVQVRVGGASSTPSTCDPWEEWLRVA